MSSAEEEFEPIGDESSQYVPAVFAHSAQEAELYRELLTDHDIPAILGVEDEDESIGLQAISRGVPVLVPYAFLEEASGIIADREDIDEFDDELDDQDDDEEDELELVEPVEVEELEEVVEEEDEEEEEEEDEEDELDDEEEDGKDDDGKEDEDEQRLK